MDPITLIVRTLGEIYLVVVVLRFMLQLANADYYNPISQAVVRLTSAPLKPLQKLVPRMGRVDLSPLLLAVLVKFAVVAIIFSLHGGSMNPASLLVFTLAGVLDTILTLYFWAVIGSVIISWVAPGSPHPGPQLISQITEPLFALAQKVIPPIGGLDLSPILIFLVIQLVQSQLAPFVI